MRNLHADSEQQRAELEMTYSGEKANLLAKIKYYEEKVKRVKTDHEDLLKKFEATVGNLARQNKGQEIKAQFDDNLKRIKQQYTDKMAEKEEAIEEERRQSKEQIYRLQTDNKQLRDKVILLEARQSTASHKQSRYFEPSIRQVESGKKGEHSHVERTSNEGVNLYNNREKDRETTTQMKRTMHMDRSQQSLNVSALT